MKFNPIVMAFGAVLVLSATTPPALAEDPPAAAGPFIAMCKAQFSTRMEGQFKRVMARVSEKASEDQKKRLNAAMDKARSSMASLCPCIASQVQKSSVLSEEDKQKIWSAKSLKRADMPQFEGEKKKHLRTVSRTCATRVRPAMAEANKEIMGVMKEVTQK